MKTVGMILMLVTGMRAMTADDGDVQCEPVLVCLNPAENARVVHSAKATSSRILRLSE